MAKLMSKKTREIVQTTTVLVLAVLFIVFYIIYPLIIVQKLTSRPNKDKFDDPSFILENNPSSFVRIGLKPDTFAVLTDDNINLAAVSFMPDTTIFDSINGTIILLHSDDTDRTSLIPYISPLLDSGLAVILYDQRACGLSGGKHFTAGVYEAEDLNQMIVHLKFHERLFRPLIVIGFGLGADAAVEASRNEKKINAVIAVDPYLTSTRWITKIREKRGALGIPLYKMVYFWWYQKLTGFPYDRTGTDDIQPVATKTLIFMDEEELKTQEAARLQEISGDLITAIVKPSDEEKLRKMVLESIYSTVAQHPAHGYQ